MDKKVLIVMYSNCQPAETGSVLRQRKDGSRMEMTWGKLETTNMYCVPTALFPPTFQHYVRNWECRGDEAMLYM